jgi:hypothetical protein
VAQLVEQEQARGLGRPAVAAAALLALALACDRVPEGGPVAASTAGAAASSAPAEGSGEIDRLRAELDAAHARIAELESDGKRAAAERIAREEEWLRYSKALTQLSTVAAKPIAEFQTMPAPQAAIAPDAAASAPEPEKNRRPRPRRPRRPRSATGRSSSR